MADTETCQVLFSRPFKSVPQLEELRSGGQFFSHRIPAVRTARRLRAPAAPADCRLRDILRDQSKLPAEQLRARTFREHDMVGKSTTAGAPICPLTSRPTQSRTTRNSSPPQRATRSENRQDERSSLANSFRIRSPTRLPYSSIDASEAIYIDHQNLKTAIRMRFVAGCALRPRAGCRAQSVRRTMQCARPFRASTDRWRPRRADVRSLLCFRQSCVATELFSWRALSSTDDAVFFETSSKLGDSFQLRCDRNPIVARIDRPCGQGTRRCAPSPAEDLSLLLLSAHNAARSFVPSLAAALAQHPVAVCNCL